MKNIFLVFVMSISFASFSQGTYEEVGDQEERLSGEFDNLVNLFRGGDFEEAIEYADKIIENADDSYWKSFIVYYKGLSYDSLNDTKNAINSYTVSLEILPRVAAYNSRASVFLGVEDYSNALKDVKSAFELINNETDAELKEIIGGVDMKVSLLKIQIFAKNSLGLNTCDDYTNLVKISSVENIPENLVNYHENNCY